MFRDRKTLKNFISICLIVIMISSVVFPLTSAEVNKNIINSSFEKGISWKPVVPLKRITFVNFDENTYLDDYAYLASIPTSIFYDKNTGVLYSNPLLFYQDNLDFKDDKEITLDARAGLDYFMDDWMGYTNGKMDHMTLINVDKNQLDYNWDSKEYKLINSEKPYEIASELALQDWSYSNEAVVAVIQEEFEEKDTFFSNKVSGKLNACNVKKLPTFNVKQTNQLNPVFHEFTVGSNYKYIKAGAWWDAILISGGFITIPAGDPDIQLYCRQDGEWMQTAAVNYWNLKYSQGREFTQSYVYSPGDWKIGITDFPTENADDIPSRDRLGGFIEVQGSLLKALSPKVTYYIDITMYPGIEIEIPEQPPYGCRDVDFKLTWNNPTINLGFTVLGPSGEAIVTMINESKTKSQELHLEQLGQCLPGETYSVSVFSLSDVPIPIDFEVEYSWDQEIPEEKGDSLTSAAEGAILGSVLNAPLLYTSADELSKETENTLLKLGVRDIYLVNIGGHLDGSVKETLSTVSNIKKDYKKLESIYDDIREITSSNDVVFTTIDPWTYWYLAESKPAGEKQGALFIGPATYLAAHHGTPVIIVENHPHLSSAVVWHNEFWKLYSSKRILNTPSIAEMVLTGKRIYDFLKLYDFDKEEDETIITVADQFDIGTTWDRIFPGVANSGRFCHSPVDTSYWISRTAFYPVLIFENPAMQGEVTLINGSTSERIYRGVFGRLLKGESLLTLGIGVFEQTRESGEEEFEYPVLCSFVMHRYRFNELGSKYYGATYQCADGLTPGETPTMEPIDQGTIEKYTGKEGSYFPDLTETEIVPLYLQRGGYEPAFSTEMNAIVNNLNQGVIMWIHIAHGSNANGGISDFWNPDEGFSSRLIGKLAKPFASAVKDENPVWGYDWLLGSTSQPDTMSMDVQGILPFTPFRIPLLPALGMDWALSVKPVREFLNNVIPFIDPFQTDNLRDGVISASTYSGMQNNFASSIEMEEAGLGNLHSTGFITSMCLTSNTYLHMMIVRHGAVFQVQDPWPTSWYGAVWRQSIPRDLALGYTVGEAYSKGMAHVGTLYLGGGGVSGNEPQWWWDVAENVVYYGDPDLRVFVPGTTYSDTNNWEKPKILKYDEELEINGHTPYGATSYPNEIIPKTFFEKYFVLIIFLIILAVLFIALLVVGRKKKK